MMKNATKHCGKTLVQRIPEHVGTFHAERLLSDPEKLIYLNSQRQLLVISYADLQRMNEVLTEGRTYRQTDAYLRSHSVPYQAKVRA
jgi:hypothetical protein